MQRKLLYIILPIFFFFFNTKVVSSNNTVGSADEILTKCSQQQEKIDTYNYLKEQLTGIDCNDTTNETYVIICNDSNIKKNLIVTELMKLDEQNEICSTQQDEVNTIIEENKEKCGKIFDDSFSDFVNGFMVFFYILGPILLIFFGSLDFAKATVASDQEALKKTWKTFSKRLLATILLFLSPVIVNFIISFNVSDKYLSGNAYSCDYEYLVYTKKYNIKYVPRKNLSNNSSNSIGGTRIGNYIIFNQSDSSWGSEKLLCSNSKTISKAGCALTAIAMQIVNSGVETTTSINPSTLNKIMKNNGTCADSKMVWQETSYATNNKFLLKDGTSIYMNGTLSQKAAELKNYISQGYYPVIQVKYGTDSSSHYVAVFEVNGTEIVIGDPAGGTLSILNNTSYPIVTQNLRTQTLLYYIAN